MENGHNMSTGQFPSALTAEGKPGLRVSTSKWALRTDRKHKCLANSHSAEYFAATRPSNMLIQIVSTHTTDWWLCWQIVEFLFCLICETIKYHTATSFVTWSRPLEFKLQVRFNGERLLPHVVLKALLHPLIGPLSCHSLRSALPPIWSSPIYGSLCRAHKVGTAPVKSAWQESHRRHLVASHTHLRFLDS